MMNDPNKAPSTEEVHIEGDQRPDQPLKKIANTQDEAREDAEKSSSPKDQA